MAIRSRPYVFLSLLILAPATAASAQDEEEELLALHRQFVVTHMIGRDPAFLLAHSLPSYRVVAPGGVVENRDQIISGFQAFAALDSVTISREEAVISGPVALVLSRQETHGELAGPAAGFGPVTTSTVFLRSDSGGWLAVSSSITPCRPRAIQAGRC